MSFTGKRVAWLEHGLVFLGLLGLMFVFAPTVEQVLNTRDHGVHLARAVQIDLGRHPFVDYPGGVYGPLVFYLSYLGQVLSGWCLLGEVVLDACGYALGYLLLYVVCRRVSGSRWIACAGLLAGVLLMPRFYKYYILLGPAVFLFALEVACRRGFRPVTLGGLALATCIVGFFRLDFGAYALFASLLVFAVAALPRNRRDFLRWLLVYAAFGLVFSAPFLLPLLLRANPFEVLGDSIALVAGAKGGLGKALDPEYGGTRFQFAFWCFRSLPWVLIAACLLRWRRLEPPSARTFLLGACAFAALVFVQASHRVDPQHLLQALPACLVLLALVAAGLQSKLPAVPARFAVVALFLAPVLLLGDSRERYDEVPSPSELLEKWGDYGKSRAELRRGQDWDQAIASWIAQVLPPAEDVLVLPYWPQLYYLAERGYGARFGWVYPGLFGERFSAQAFLESLGDTPVVVDEVGFAFDGDPDRSLRAFAPGLMERLYQDYAIVYSHGFGVVLTDDPRVLAQASLPDSFLPVDGVYEARPAGWFELQTMNTIEWTSAQPLQTIRGGAFVLGGGLRTRPEQRLWVLLSGEQTYRAQASVRGTSGGVIFQCMADTKALAPGVYEVELALGSSRAGRRTSTGRKVKIVELP